MSTKKNKKHFQTGADSCACGGLWPCKSKTTKTMKMYVWQPESLADYTSGMVCVIAESKDAAIELAALHRHPHCTLKMYDQINEPKTTLKQINAGIDAERERFRAERFYAKKEGIRV